MGYYIKTNYTHFAIRKTDLPRFFDLVSDLMTDENIEKYGNGGSYSPNGGKTKSWFSWVSTEEVRKAVQDRDIIRVFAEWGYELDETHEMNGIHFYRLDIRGGEAKIGDEEKFFAAIAPVVVDGCHLDVEGEDGAEWRWMWENGKFYSQDVASKNIIFAEPIEITLNP